MPDQACANGMKLDGISQDLDNLFTLERCLISFQLPFITVIVMRRYGGHYKISGRSVNVPANIGSSNQHTATYAQPTTIIPC